MVYAEGYTVADAEDDALAIQCVFRSMRSHDATTKRHALRVKALQQQLKAKVKRKRNFFSITSRPLKHTSTASSSKREAMQVLT
jgi:hypothetical protein